MPDFESANLEYREIRESDAEDIVRWKSDPAVYALFRNPKPITLAEHLAWYNESYLKNPARTDFIITEKESGVPIGIAGMAMDPTLPPSQKKGGVGGG